MTLCLKPSVSDLQWNIQDTFCGELIDPVEPDLHCHATSEELSSIIDNHTLLHDTLLAAPLLKKGSNFKDIKWCGNTDVTQSWDSLAQVIEAYNHHTLVDSDHEWLLADIQGMWLSKPSSVVYCADKKPI